MNIPTTLKHKPVIVGEEYEKIDGRSAYFSDVKGLSLGLAQWNDRGNVEISAKVWRYTGEKWSRQSEELPLHRVIDLALLICKSKKFIGESYRYVKGYNPDDTQIGRIEVQGDAMNINVCTENPMIDKDIKLFTRVFGRDDELLSERLHLLANTLIEMGYGNRKNLN